MNAPATPAEIQPVELPEPGLADRVLSAATWASGLAWMVPSMTALTALHTLLPERWVKPLDRYYCLGQLASLGVRWRAEVHADVDPDRPYMFLQNHSSHLDHVSLAPATHHIKQGIELREHFRYPIYGWFMKARGTIPVDRGASDQRERLLEHMRDEVARGHSLIAFPEGTRTRTGYVGPFRRGLFYMARDLGVPIAPAAVTGMYLVMRPQSLVIRPFQEVTVHIDEPIETAGLSDAEIPALAEHTRELIARRVDRFWEEWHQDHGAKRPEGTP